MSEYSHEDGEHEEGQPAKEPVAVVSEGAQPASGLYSLLYNHKGRVRAPWRLLSWIVLVFASSLVAAAIALALGSSGGLDGGAIAYYVLLCLGATVVSILFLQLDRPPSRPLAALGLAWHRRVLYELGLGTAIGLVMNLGVFVIALAAGFLRTQLSEDLDVLALLAIFATLVFAALLEELYFRGYAMQVLIESAGVWPAILLTSVVFGALHNANPHASLLSFMNTTLAGVLLAVLYLRTRSLWLPTVVHISWNVAMAPVLGMPVSGIDLPARVLDTELTNRGLAAELLSGGSYGPEGGLLLTLVVIPLIVWTWRTRMLQPVAELQPNWVADREIPKEETTAVGA